MKLSYFDEHVLLYAKSWYKESDTLNDLRTILTRSLHPEVVNYIHEKDVMGMVAQTMFRVAAPLKDSDISTLFVYIWEDNLWRSKAEVSKSDVLRSMLSVMRFKEVNFTESPDSTILPLAHEDSMERWHNLSKKLIVDN